MHLGIKFGAQVDGDGVARTTSDGSWVYVCVWLLVAAAVSLAGTLGSFISRRGVLASMKGESIEVHIEPKGWDEARQMVWKFVRVRAAVLAGVVVLGCGAAVVAYDFDGAKIGMVVFGLALLSLCHWYLSPFRRRVHTTTVANVTTQGAVFDDFIVAFGQKRRHHHSPTSATWTNPESRTIVAEYELGNSGFKMLAVIPYAEEDTEAVEQVWGRTEG